MSTLTIHQKPKIYASMRALIARHPVIAYLVMAFMFAWTITIPLLLSKQGFGLLPIELPLTLFQIFASFFGLALPAFLVTAATEGKAGVHTLLQRCLRWRVSIQWYLIALLGIFVCTLVIAIPFVGLASLQTVAQKWTLFFTVLLPGTLLPLLHTNLPEEIGWTGYLQSTLQERHRPVRASIMVAPVFALMHLPAYFVTGWISDEKMLLPEVIITVGITAVFAIFFRIVIMWLYNGTGGSLLIVALFHSSFNMYTGQKITPQFVQGLEATWLNLLPIAAVALAAILLTVLTRGRLAYKPAQ